MFKQLSRLGILSLLLLGVFVMVLPSHAQTIVPIASTFSGVCAGVCTTTVTFTVKNTGDILALAIAYRTNNVNTEQTPTVTDGSNTWTQRVHAAQALGGSNEAEGQVWTTTAAASGSLTITVSFASVGPSQFYWITAFDLVSYTLLGLTTSTGGGTSGTTASVSNMVIPTQSAVIGAVDGATMFLPLTSTDAIGYITCGDAADFGVGHGCGANFFNGGFTSAGATFPSTLADGNTWSVWAEGVLVLPEVAQITTITSTSTTTTTTATTNTVTTTKVGIIIQTTTQNGLPVISSPSLLEIIIITVIVVGLIGAALLISGLGRKGRR